MSAQRERDWGPLKPQPLCAQCGQRPVPLGRRKYCSDRCREYGRGLMHSRYWAASRAKRTPRPGEPLSQRERQVLEAVEAGETREETADRLGLSVHTVKHLIEAARIKLGARTKAQALARLIRADYAERKHVDPETA